VRMPSLSSASPFSVVVTFSVIVAWFCSLPADAFAAQPSCPTTAPAIFPTGGTNPQVVSIAPMSFYEGSILTLKVNGANLDPTWNMLLCPSGVKSTAQPTVAALDATSTKTALSATVNAPPGSAGSYSVYFEDSTSKFFDSGQKVVINSSDDTKYQPCVGPNGSVPININIQCSFSPLSYDSASDIFGKGVAQKFVAVYVIIQNKNQSLEYLLQDIRGGFPNYQVSSYDKQIPQAVSTKEEQFSARAIIFRLTAAAASVLTGISGVVSNQILQDAVIIFAGPAQAGIQTAIPDLSAAELNRLNQLGFSVTSTEIPKGSAIALVAFIPADTLGSPNCFTASQSDKTTACSTKQKSHNFQKYKGTTLQSLFQTMTVAVAGVHVQQVTPSAQPTLKLLINPPSLQDFSAGVTVTIEGSGFDTLKGVELINGSTVIIAKLQALPNASSTTIDPSVANLVIPATPATTAGPGKYEINFILADGTVEDTTQSITIPTPPIVSAAITTPATFALIPSGGSLTLQLTGTNLTQIKAVALQGSGAAISGTISATATGQITVTFPQASLAAGTYKVLIGTNSAAEASTYSGQTITL